MKTKTKVKRLRGKVRKSQIVSVALKLFSKKGFRGTTTREIAEKAGVSEAVIFKHFKKKESLYGAIIGRCCDDTSGSFMFMARIKGKRGHEAFKEIARFFLEHYRKDPALARLIMFSALERNKFSDIFIKSRAVETLGYLSAEIRMLIREGKFKKRDPELSARAFLGMVIHYCTMQEIYGFKRFFSKPEDEVVNTFVDIFFNGMAKRLNQGRKPA